MYFGHDSDQIDSNRPCKAVKKNRRDYVRIGGEWCKNDGYGGI